MADNDDTQNYLFLKITICGWNVWTLNLMNQPIKILNQLIEIQNQPIKIQMS